MKAKATIFLSLIVIVCYDLQSQTIANIYTPACTPLYNCYYFSEYSSGYINDLNQAYIQAYPNAIFVGNSSGTYNCHGYAWYVTEGGENVWIGAYAGQGDPEEEFMNDGSYIEVSTESAAQKVSYRNSDHSAITTSTPGWLQSKWADGPIMKHRPGDCPFSYSYLRYYTSIKNITGTIYSGTYSAYGEVVSTGQVAQSSSVSFKSGRKVRLNPGFSIQNATFTATIFSACWPASYAGPVSEMYSEASTEFKSSEMDLNSEKQSVSNYLSDDNFYVYPNPVYDVLNIEGINNYSLKVINCYGKLIMSKTNISGSVDVSSLPPGFYLIQVSYEGKLYTQKIIKN